MVKIKIYSTTTCVYCHMLMDYLDNLGFAYEEVQLDEYPEEIQASIDTCGNMGVPCTHITLDDGTETHVLGFDREKIDEVLEIV